MSAVPDLPADLQLRVMPPRVPRHLMTRQRLQLQGPLLRGYQAVRLQAPAGFGKTSLLAQWRLESLALGRVVAWWAADVRDQGERLLQALVVAVRLGAGRPGFGHTLLAASAPQGLEGVTAWLAEVAQTALEMVLIVDDADRLAASSRSALGYLMRNAPPNLTTLVAARAEAHLDVDDLVAYGACAAVGPAQLRFALDESLELLRLHGSTLGHDDAARLHEQADGWPLGLQIGLQIGAQAALSAPGAGDGQAAAADAYERIVSRMLGDLGAEDMQFLVQVAVLDPLHPSLCEAVAQDPLASERLSRLLRETPLLVAGGDGDGDGEWLRLHNLVREALRARHAGLSQEQRTQLHARAAAWMAGRGLLEGAAAHAFDAGQHDLAYDLAERSLYASLMTRGRQTTVLDWLARLPAAEVDRRPRLLLAAAWSLAVSERHDEADRLVERILAQAPVGAELRCECALIQSGAAVFADDPDRFASLHDPWALNPPLRDPWLLHVHGNRSAYRSLLQGEPGMARLRLQHTTAAGRAPDYLTLWGDCVVGLSHLREGQVRSVEQVLHPVLARAEAEMGRRSPFCTMLATVLAAALWDQGQDAQAAALLANRLDVLERSGLPEAVMLGFVTLARMADAAGDEPRAQELLEALEAVGAVRHLPRLRLASLAEQVRLHARRYRAETCGELCERMQALLADPAVPQGPLWQRQAGQLRDVALVHWALAQRQWRQALQHLAAADDAARQARLGRLHIELLGLRAWALDQCGEPSAALLREAVDLADSHGLRRVLAEAHPDLGAWVQRSLQGQVQVQGQVQGKGRGQGQGLAPRAEVAAAAAAPAGWPTVRATPSMALTPKERQVLELLARNLSNKEIGLALQVGEETVKWHLKNLFAKLDAGTRKQLVQRAHLLGLLATP